MPTFEERFEVQAPLEAVWDFLLDPVRLAPCIPGCDGFAVLEGTLARALETPVSMEFMAVTSYGSSTSSTGIAGTG